MFDLDDAYTREALERQILADIDAWCVWKYADAMRSHLGASIIGHNCARYIWYGFRWVYEAKHSGRLFRLFNRGHKEEDRFIESLDGIGTVVSAHTDEGLQHRISDVEGHFGGSLDSVLQLASRYQIKQSICHAEFKTHNDRSFQKLKKEGVARSKPQHFAQMSTYGFKRNVEWTLYLAINKNDDDIYLKFIKNDFGYAEDLLRKALDIIVATTPPRRIAASASHYECAYCDARNVCWNRAQPALNCRSCCHASARANKSWYCSKFNTYLDPEFIKQGCQQWQSLPVHE